jgi:hypothetical protein
MTLDEALHRVIEGCNAGGIHYALAGGFAFSIYCAPRATVDIDLVMAGSPEDLLPALRSRFQSLYRNETSMTYRLVRVHRLLLIEQEREVILDLLEPTDPDLARSIHSTARKIVLQGTTIRVIAPELLYVLKRDSNRPQDQLDADTLLSTRGATFDHRLVEPWVDSRIS